MEGTTEGVCEEMEAIASSVEPSDPSFSSEDQTMSFDQDAFHMNIAIDITENDDLLVENEFIDAVNEIDGRMVYPCNMCKFVKRFVNPKAV